MLKIFLILLFITSPLAIAACSNEEDKTTTKKPAKEHFASDQKRALDKAKGVEKMLQDNADKRAQQIEEQSR